MHQAKSVSARRRRYYLRAHRACHRKAIVPNFDDVMSRAASSEDEVIYVPTDCHTRESSRESPPIILIFPVRNNFRLTALLVDLVVFRLFMELP